MAKKVDKSKFLSKDLNDLLNESQFMKNSPKPKRVQKRQKEETDEEEGNFSKLIAEYQGNKKKKSDPEHRQSRQKLLEVMEHQLGARKQVSDNIASALSDVLAQQEADCNMLAENEKKLEHLVGAFLKCVQQSTSAARKNLSTLKEIHNDFMKEYEDLEATHKVQNEKLADQLEEDMQKLHQKLVSETKRKQLDNLRKSIFNAMQNDF